MRDLLTALAAVAAAVTTLCALLVNFVDVTPIQEKLAAEKGVDAPDVLEEARKRLNRRKYLWVVIPGFAAFALSLSAIFVPSSESKACTKTASHANGVSSRPLTARTVDVVQTGRRSAVDSCSHRES
jgi:hypothetical protein